MKKSILLPTLVSSMALVLAACGGGGGSSDSGERPDPDTTAPVITITGGNLEINQNAVYNDAGATAEDAVDGSVEVTATNTVNTSVVGAQTVTYTAVDAAGNESTAVRTVTVKDVTAPIISITSGIETIIQNAPYNDAGATAVDNVDGNVTVTTANGVNISVVGTHTVVYTAVDAAGNKSSAVRTVTVTDVTPPIISVIGGTATVIEGASYNDAGANALDAVDGSVAVFASSIDTTVAGVKTVTYTAIDAAGNSAVAERNVKVIRPSSFDTFDGTWRSACVTTDVLPGATNAKQEFSLEAGKLVNNVMAYATSDCTGDTVYNATAEADVEFGGQVNTGACVAERVDTDITSAVVNGETLNPADIQDFISVTNFPVYNLFCLNNNVDLLGGDVSGANDGSSEANRPTEMDVAADGSFAKVDTIVPNITMVGSDSFTIDVGTTYVDAGATASDDQDGDLAVTATVTSSTDPDTVIAAVDANVADTYEVVYSASDAEGNTTTAKRVVKVVRGAGTFTAFDGEWASDCISNSNPALTAVGVRAINKYYTISDDVNTSLINGYSTSNCSGAPHYLGFAEVGIVYSGEIDEAACASGKAEKVDLTVAEARINNAPPLSDEDLDTFMQATEFPAFNLLCVDTNGELREGNVVGELDGLKESKRPNEIDMTGVGLVKQ